MTKELYKLVALPIKCKEVAVDLRALNEYMCSTDYPKSITMDFMKMVAYMLEHDADIMLDCLEKTIYSANI